MAEDAKTVLIIVADGDTLSRAKKMLAHCEAKAAQQTTPIDRFYYLMCAAGWKRHIAKLEAEEIHEAVQSDPIF